MGVPEDMEMYRTLARILWVCGLTTEEDSFGLAYVLDTALYDYGYEITPVDQES